MMSMGLMERPSGVAAGVVTFVAANVGFATHELVVIPLTGESPGGLRVGAQDKVDESTSRGEASKSCGEGAGEGITAGNAGWVSMTLPAGRYALVCNEPSHYRAGMFAQLTVT